MTFFKLPTLFSRHKKTEDDLEKLFMLPEQQRSSPVSEKNISVSASSPENNFQPPDENRQMFTSAAHPFKQNRSEHQMQNASEGAAESVALPAQSNEMTQRFQNRMQSIVQNNTVSLQKENSSPPPENSGQKMYFSTDRYTSPPAEKNSRQSILLENSGQPAEVFHSLPANPSSGEMPLEHVQTDSGHQSGSGNFLQMNNNLNTLTNYAKNQLRYLKKNCELLQNQSRSQTFN